ncbi:MAG: hypothetical protein KC619_06200 [Myxococcales bacterium]|nr:hypothetical protein [Myxococcales bacterium]
MSDDDEHEPSDSPPSGEGVEGAAETISGLTEAASGIARAVGGEEGAAVADALDTAGAVVSAAGSVAGVVDAAQRGDAAGAVSSGIGGAGAAARNIVPAQEADAVMRGAQTASRLAGQIGGAADQGGAPGGGGAGGFGDHGTVDFELEVEGIDGQWVVQHVAVNEGLNRVPSCVVDVRHDGRPEVSELLRVECVLRITRGEEQRSFKGIIWDAHVHEGRDWVEIQLHIVAALQLLSQRSRSRIFQAKTVPEVFEQVYTEALRDLRRSVQNDLQATYETREYIVQYQESELAFLSRRWSRPRQVTSSRFVAARMALWTSAT